MAEPFLGEIRIVSFNFPPKGWAQCNGQLMPINQNQALFSILGTTYGGDGRVTFALPNLQGRTPLHTGNGISLGEIAGEENHTLIVTEMPLHVHAAKASDAASDAPIPGGALLAADTTLIYAPPNANLVALQADTIAAAGASQAHPNMMPFLTLNFCIALAGIYPSRG